MGISLQGGLQENSKTCEIFSNCSSLLVETKLVKSEVGGRDLSVGENLKSFCSLASSPASIHLGYVLFSVQCTYKCFI